MLNPVKWLEQILTRYRVSPLAAEEFMPFSKGLAIQE
jgi:hypothetical protein